MLTKRLFTLLTVLASLFKKFDEFVIAYTYFISQLETGLLLAEQNNFHFTQKSILLKISKNKNKFSIR